MKYISLLLFLSIPITCFSQGEEWIKTEGEIVEITVHSGRKTREIATVKFRLESGVEQIGSAELIRVPIIGSMKSVGDIISVNYRKSNPAVLETDSGNFISQYGMYVLVFLGIIFSIKPFLKK